MNPPFSTMLKKTTQNYAENFFLSISCFEMRTIFSSSGSFMLWEENETFQFHASRSDLSINLMLLQDEKKIENKFSLLRQWSWGTDSFFWKDTGVRIELMTGIRFGVHQMGIEYRIIRFFTGLFRNFAQYRGRGDLPNSQNFYTKNSP